MTGTLAEEVGEIKRIFGIVGRDTELERALAAMRSGKHLMIEGPVGVGKTVLATAVARHLGRPVFRVDGDERYTEQKLSGWFDPPVVLEKGYIQEAFVPGPLTLAMREGGILFINELNRMPEGVQNVLLPAMDENMIEVPKVGTIKAKKGFVVIATQNPREFVATTALSEALSDRFELLLLDYQSEIEEIEIARRNAPGVRDEVIARSVWIARRTREHPSIRRGASVRAAISTAQLASGFVGDLQESVRKAAQMALPTRIEMREEARQTAADVINEIVNECFSLPPIDPGGTTNQPNTDVERRRRLEEDERIKKIDVTDLVQIMRSTAPEELFENEDISLAIARNYSQLRTRLGDLRMVELAKRIAIRAVIRHVLQLLGPVSMPTRLVRSAFTSGNDGEIDVDATIENMIEHGRVSIEDIVLEQREPKRISVALMLDASLSMSGDKLAMATAAIAVLAFRLKTVDFVVLTFNDRPTVIKKLDQPRNVDELISQLLDFSAQGYTNIEWALKKGKEELDKSVTKNQVGVLITDGNFTVGDDPTQAASAYKRLFVIMTESHDCRPGTCQAMASNGGGRMYDVASFDEIPRVLYRVLRLVSQGSPHRGKHQ